jgi:hypothetical protein
MWGLPMQKVSFKYIYFGRCFFLQMKFYSEYLYW